MYILIIIYPLLSGIISGLFSRFFGREGSILLSLSLNFFSFLLSIFIFFEVSLSFSLVSIKIFQWIHLDIFIIDFGLLFDSLTCIMLIIITGISFLVHLYSLEYMSADPHLSRFISYLSIFTFFMLVLVTADNLLQMFFGWEGVGFCSYLLINFWFTRVNANKASLKAMIINRIADVFFIIAIIILFLTFKTTNYLIIFNLIDFILDDKIILFGYSIKLLDAISFFLFIGAIGKSAQLGLHTWLPDAMEGPTPVSSLLHAATMVTAGIFLFARCSFIFEFSPNILFIISILGGLTACFFSIISIFQFDIKKIIAYSTCSQLGYMTLACGLSHYQVAIFHLFLHAFFKALLFLSVGYIIHILKDEQDIRKMGFLINFLPFTYINILIGSLAIMGFPFLTGFFSKDLILELTFVRYIVDALYIYILAISSAFFTVVYSFRLLGFIFFFKNNLFKSVFPIYENSSEMHISMFILCIASIIFGYLFNDFISGWGTYIWNNSLYISFINFNYFSSYFLSPWLKNIPLILTIFGMLLSFYLYKIPKIQYKKYNIKYIYIIFFKIWFQLNYFFYFAGYFNKLYNLLFIFIFQNSYFIFNKYLDKGFIEYLGPFGFYKSSRKLSFTLRNFPTQVLSFFLGFMFFNLSLIIFILFLFKVSIFFYNILLLYIILIYYFK